MAASEVINYSGTPDWDEKARELTDGRGITVGAINVGSRADFEAMNRAIALHRLRPLIDRTFHFAEAKEAYRHFESRGHLGKVVITHG